MSRARRVMTLLPAMVAGGILFGAAFGHASSGDDGAPGDAVDHRAAPPRVADAPLPPLPPAPPAPPDGWGPGRGGRLGISIGDGKLHVEGLSQLVRHQLDAARDLIRNNPSIPPEARDRALARLDRARAIIERRLAHLGATDLDQLGDEMERMGEELEQAMAGLDEDLEALGGKLGKDLARRLGKELARGLGPRSRVEHRHDADRRAAAERDDEDDAGDAGDADDSGDADDEARGGDRDRVTVAGPDDAAAAQGALRDLPDVGLRPGQREQIVRLRSSYEQQIATARKQLDDASRRLEVALADPRTSDADISRYVDQVSSYEAAIRKARLLTWVNARRLLDDSQRQKIEDAAGKRRR